MVPDESKGTETLASTHPGAVCRLPNTQFLARQMKYNHNLQNDSHADDIGHCRFMAKVVDPYLFVYDFPEMKLCIRDFEYRGINLICAINVEQGDVITVR